MSEDHIVQQDMKLISTMILSNVDTLGYLLEASGAHRLYQLSALSRTFFNL